MSRLPAHLAPLAAAGVAVLVAFSWEPTPTAAQGPSAPVQLCIELVDLPSRPSMPPTVSEEEVVSALRGLGGVVVMRPVCLLDHIWLRLDWIISPGPRASRRLEVRLYGLRGEHLVLSSVLPRFTSADVARAIASLIQGARSAIEERFDVTRSPPTPGDPGFTPFTGRRSPRR
jgi:hypothetical protein